MSIEFALVFYLIICIFVVAVFCNSLFYLFSNLSDFFRFRDFSSLIAPSILIILSPFSLVLFIGGAIELEDFDKPKIETSIRVDTYSPEDVKIKTLATETVKIDLETSRSLLYHEEHTTGTLTKRVAGVGDYVILDNGAEAEIKSTVSDPKLEEVQVKVTVVEEVTSFDKDKKREFSTLINKLLVEYPGYQNSKKDSVSEVKEVFAEIHHPQVEE